MYEESIQHSIAAVPHFEEDASICILLFHVPLPLSIPILSSFSFPLPLLLILTPSFIDKGEIGQSVIFRSASLEPWSGPSTSACLTSPTLFLSLSPLPALHSTAHSFTTHSLPNTWKKSRPLQMTANRSFAFTIFLWRKKKSRIANNQPDSQPHSNASDQVSYKYTLSRVEGCHDNCSYIHVGDAETLYQTRLPKGMKFLEW